MKIETNHVVEMTLAEITNLVKSAHNLDGNIVLKIVDQVEVAPDEQLSDFDKGLWVDVPPDWNLPECPHDFDHSTMIDIQLRNGECDYGEPSFWTKNWQQDDHPFDIVCYRRRIK
jgi:hypothetical protein